MQTIGQQFFRRGRAGSANIVGADFPAIRRCPRQSQRARPQIKAAIEIGRNGLHAGLFIAASSLHLEPVAKCQRLKGENTQTRDFIVWHKGLVAGDRHFTGNQLHAASAAPTVSFCLYEVGPELDAFTGEGGADFIPFHLDMAVVAIGAAKLQAFEKTVHVDSAAHVDARLDKVNRYRCAIIVAMIVIIVIISMRMAVA